MRADFLSYFTPSLMSAKTLEDIFVQREGLAQEVVEVIAESALTPSKHYSLLIGPRGIGKTHLVSLIYHRVCRREDLRDRLRVAWLREEEWGVSSSLDLLLRLLTALQAEYKDAALAEKIEALYSLPAVEAEHAAAAVLKDYVGERALLVLAENLDDLFEGMGEVGQKRLRSFIQENPFWIIVATAQSLFKDVSRRTSPFYGFFTIHLLEDLSLDDATALLTKIADLEDKRDLSAFIQAPMGRARIRAVHHLAGGNPRVYVIFSQFLTREALDELVDPFMHMLDELTPYYQAKMKWLSSQQRKIVDFLLAHRGAVPVKEIAKRCFITQQTASSQLQDLRTKGYVVSEAVGRESYYELREPLMRMCIDVKKSRGGPIKLFVDFLRLWYSYDELKQCLATLKPNAPLEREYMQHALRIVEKEEDPRVAACKKDANLSLNNGNYTLALKAAEELVAIRGYADDLILEAECLTQLGEFEKALKLCDDISSKSSDNSHQNAHCWALKADIYRRTGQLEQALDAYDAAVDSEKDVWQFWYCRGQVLRDLNRFKQALASFNRALRTDGSYVEVWYAKAESLYQMGRDENALKAYNKAINLDHNYHPAWLGKGVVASRLELNEEALTALLKATELQPDDGATWFIYGQTLLDTACYDDAVVSLRKAIDLDYASPCPFFEIAEALFALDRDDEAVKEMEHALDRRPRSTTTKRRQEKSPHFARHTSRIIERILEKDSNPSTWDVSVNALAEVYNRHKATSLLAQGLLLTYGAVTNPMLNTMARYTWLEIWEAAAHGDEELEFSLRLLRTALTYTETQDPRVLLELPSEERHVLRQMLEIEENNQPNLFDI